MGCRDFQGPRFVAFDVEALSRCRILSFVAKQEICECPALKKNLGPVVLAIFVFYTKIILFVPNKIVPYRLVRRETLAATEGELYLAVLRWAQHRIAAGLEDNLRHPAIAD